MNDKNYLGGNEDAKFFLSFSTDVDTILERCTSINECMQCNNSNHSQVLKLFLGGSLMMETLIMLNRLTGFIDRYDDLLNESIWKQLSFTLKKYDPFIQEVKTSKANYFRNYEFILFRNCTTRIATCCTIITELQSIRMRPNFKEDATIEEA